MNEAKVEHSLSGQCCHSVQHGRTTAAVVMLSVEQFVRHIWSFDVMQMCDYEGVAGMLARSAVCWQSFVFGGSPDTYLPQCLQSETCSFKGYPVGGKETVCKMSGVSRS